MIDRDRFGVEMLHPTVPGGREWFCKWDNGHARALESVSTDADDPEFHLRGTEGTLAIDGRGVARLIGAGPRMYVYDDVQKWRNVEVTFYARRIAEFQFKSSQGFVVGARSEHQAVTEMAPCKARTYYGRVLYDGRADFLKELKHSKDGLLYTKSRPEKQLLRWNPPNPELPYGEWIGVKFVVRNMAADTQVRLELYRDRSGGMASGAWEPLIPLDDTGNWTESSDCPHPPGQVFTEASTSVFIRNDFLIAAEYARFSIREIAPI